MNLVLYLVLAGPLLWYFYKFLIWFAAPVKDGFKKEEVLKEYTFIEPKTKKAKKFETVNHKAKKSISLVVPAYNEEDRISQMLDSTIKYLQTRTNNAGSKSAFNWEIIVVSDGSTDKTCDIVNGYSKRYGTDYVRLLSYDENQGKGYAVQQVES